MRRLFFSVRFDTNYRITKHSVIKSVEVNEFKWLQTSRVNKNKKRKTR